jgi:hypothetical protein
MLSVMALGLLVAAGSAQDMSMGFADDGSGYNEEFYGMGGHKDGRGDHFPDQNKHFPDNDNRHDFNKGHGHDNFDWLNPGGTYSYSYWYYPSNSYYWYPYTYTYPVTYTAPVTYPTTYTYYYDPMVYDPWYAANVYGWAGTTHYYSGSWSWSRLGGYYFI